MKIKSTFKKTTCWFEFELEEQNGENTEASESKTAAVQCSIMDENQSLLWNGIVQSEINPFGIYPKPIAIQKIPLPDSIKKMFLVELRRYLKPLRLYL